MRRERERTVRNKLGVVVWKIDNLFSSYYEDRLVVNRHYQRRLVWSLQEKKDLIDSIMDGIPLPAILMVEYCLDGDSDETYEIIDGLQRINAIVSFILGEFPVEYDGRQCYFDSDACIELRSIGEDSRKDSHKDYLPIKVCRKFLSYELSIVYTGQDDEMIEKIFKRINSTGRKVTSQDIRQVGASSQFSETVRNIASSLRMDITYSNVIAVSDMPKISLTDDSELSYGVKMHELFWRRHDIMTFNDLRESRDEEIIASLLIALLLNRDFIRSKELLDDAYAEDSELAKELDNAVKEYDSYELVDSFVKIFDMIDVIFGSVNSDFTSWLFENRRKTKGKLQGFSVLFLTLYRLVNSGYQLDSATNVADQLREYRNLFDFNLNKADYKQLNKNVKQLRAGLKDVMQKDIQVRCSAFEKDLDERLGRSSIESQMFEYKIGISEIISGNVADRTLKRIARTIVAMATTESDEDGLIVLGIANNEEAYRDWQKQYNASDIVVKQHHIVGIEQEALRVFGSVDMYVAEIRKRLKKEPITTELKDQVLSSFQEYDYHGKSVIAIKVKKRPGSLYGRTKYVREGNETVRYKE